MQVAILWYDNDKQLNLEFQDIEKYKMTPTSATKQSEKFSHTNHGNLL